MSFNIFFVFFVQNSFDVWVWKSLLADSTVADDSFNLHLKFFINISTTGYIFINEGLANQICEKLQITYMKLNWLKSVEEYDDQVTLKSIIYIIYSTLTVKGHKKLTVSMFITYLRHQGTILRNSWMTHHDVWPDLINHFIVYISHFCDYFEINYSWIQSLSKFLNNAVKEQKQQKFTENSQKNNSFKICEINTAVYHTLIK